MIVHIFIQPGDISKAVGTPTHEFVSNFSKATKRTLKDSMRSTEYDTVSDRYARFLRDEIIPEVAKKYNLRKDSYSHAISGSSSGGIAAFNAAWQMPDLFSRVSSHVGTYTSIQWTPGKIEGGEILPFRVRKDPKRNIRVWLQDGSEDLENRAWKLAIAEHSDGELAQDARLRLSPDIRAGTALRSAWRSADARIAAMALARLRSGENRAGLRAGSRGTRKTSFSRPHLQSRFRVDQPSA